MTSKWLAEIQRHFWDQLLGPDLIRKQQILEGLISPGVKIVHGGDSRYCYSRLESTSSVCWGHYENDPSGREMVPRVHEQCLDLLRNELRWKTNIKSFWQMRKSTLRGIHDVLYMCWEEEERLINEDKQEALPKLFSQILFCHVVQVEGSGKKQSVL